MRQRTTIRDYEAESAIFARRAMVAIVIVVAAIVLLASNMFHLQVSEHAELQTRSNDNRIKLVPLAPNRGLIYDRNGVLLAKNKPIYSIDITPEEITNLDSTLNELQELLGFPDETLEQFTQNLESQRRFNNVPLLDDINESDLATFAAHQHKFPGVSLEARLIRSYPYKELLTHVVGYVAKINQQDVNRLREQNELANYAASRTIGKLGIEKYYEQKLHGTVGYQSVEVNNRGRAVRTLSIEAPEPGVNIMLELDIELQKKAVELLGDSRGSIILLDNETGGVLAMASTPSYNPNWFVNGISVKQYQSLLNSKDSPLLNRTTQGAYPPASTIKSQVALLGLETGTITKDTRIWDPGWFEIKGVDRRYRDWLSWGHGWVDVTSAITESCDTFYYDLSLKLGIDKMSKFMTEFGFGELTGIDIHEEVPALMPSRGWKRARFGQPWYAGETLSVGIGQSYWTATPIQLAVSTATIANEGTHIIPRLLRGTVDGGQVSEALITHRKPVKLQDPSHWTVVKDAMKMVNMSQTGTARRAFKNAEYSSAGKTGTAQVRSLGEDEEYNAEEIAERYRDNAMYVGYAPADNPKVTIVVAIENSLGGGGSVAAPVARKMLDEWHLRYMIKDNDQAKTHVDD